jgi:aminoglycoside 6-adenylyltransferase
MSAMDIDGLFTKILEWARGDPNVIALILTGSRSRMELVDEFSDLDIEVVAQNIEALTRDTLWLERFGPVMVRLNLSTPDGSATRLVFYKGGHKVDFTLCDQRRVDRMKDGLDVLYDRGFSVLLDKTGVTEGLPPPSFSLAHATPPTQEQFHHVVNEFLFEAAHIPRYLLRQELWVAKTRDWTMKQDLLKMLEWKAATSAEGYPGPLYIGTYMRSWVDQRTWQDLASVFGPFDRNGSWNALLRTIELFRRIAKQVAEQASLGYPDETDSTVTEYITSFANRFESY